MCEVKTNIKTYVRFYYMNVIDTTMSVATVVLLVSHTYHLMVRVCMMLMCRLYIGCAGYVDVLALVSTAAGYA